MKAPYSTQNSIEKRCHNSECSAIMSVTSCTLRDHHRAKYIKVESLESLLHTQNFQKSQQKAEISSMSW